MKFRQILQTVFIIYVLAAGEYGFSQPLETAPAISDILVEIQDAPGNETELLEMAKSLIIIRQGEAFSPERLQQSLDALKLCRKFETIRADSKEPEPGKLTLVFQLKPFRYIKGIEIEGASPFFERDILNVMTLYTGDAFVQKELPRQAELIQKIFQKEGFLNPKVDVSAQEAPEDGNFTVFVKINRGAYYSVKELELTGNKSFSDQRLKLRMKTWAAALLPGGPGRFIEKNLKEDIKNLTEYYRSKRYPDISITYEVKKDPEAKTASLLVAIDEGNFYEIEFRGNEEFWDMTLKKDLAMFQEGNRNDAGIKKSVKKIKTRYRNAGYLETDIKIEDSEDTDRAIRNLCFVIAEGPQSVADSVEISGNQVFDDEKIKKQMLTHTPGIFSEGAFVPEILEDDMAAIQTLYLQEGYMNTEVRKELRWSEDKQNVSVFLEIGEGVQTCVSSVEISESTVISHEEAYKAVLVKQGEPFRQDMIQNDENALASLISEKGHPHVAVKGTVSMSADQSEASVVYTIDEGPYVEMGDVYFSGNFRTKQKILLNELEIKPEAPFSLVKLLESQRNVRNMDIFDSVQFKAIGLKEKSDRVNLFVETEEKKPYFVQVGVGYDTQRSFFAHAKSGDRNLFGTNKSAWMEGEVSEILSRGEIGLAEPRLFGTRIAATFGVFAEEKEEFNQAFGIRSFGSSLGFNRKWFEHINTSLNLRFEQREQFRRDSADAEDLASYSSDELETRRMFVTTPSISYDTRDSFIRPKKGMFSSISVDISQGLENSVDNFLKYRLDTRFYWSPAERLTFACYGRAGYIDPFGSQEKVPDDQLFFLGGTSDVRGFKENMLCFDSDRDPLGGQSAISGSLEARIDVGMNLELTTFYDIGQLSDTFDESDSGSLRSTAGLGLRYITPIGPIGFLYGFKLDKEEGESSGRLHFSMGYTF
jgi:outer membrane protein insertion porin family